MSRQKMSIVYLSLTCKLFTITKKAYIRLMYTIYNGAFIKLLPCIQKVNHSLCRNDKFFKGSQKP